MNRARTLWLWIEADEALITGRLGDGQEDWAFVGWLELGAALHSAIGAAPDPVVGRPATEGES